jgi:hypothetical protein
MVNKLWRMLIIAAGAASIITVPIGTANASVGAAKAPAPRAYTSNLIGPISSQAQCNADSAAENDPPQEWTSACRFSATHPGTSVSDPGWYYNLHVLITP